MSSWIKPLHQYISNNPPVAALPSRLVNKSIMCLMKQRYPTDEPIRDIACQEFDPYIFAPKIYGLHGCLAYNPLALRLLKSVLSQRKDEDKIREALDTLNDLLHNREKGGEALHLNITFQLRHLLEHPNEKIREKSLESLLILAGQPKGRLKIAKDEKVMNRIVELTKDTESSVRWTVHNLICRLSTYYFAVPILLKLEMIKHTMDELKRILNDAQKSAGELISECGEEEDLNCNEENVVEDEFEEVIPEESDAPEECVLTERNEKDNQTDILSTLLETLVNLMGSNENATLDAICFDALLLKHFLSHEDRQVRILTVNVFKQIFTTEIGRLALVPHDLLNSLIDAFWENPNDEEQREALGALMLSLLSPENRAAAYNSGMMDKVIEIAKRPQGSSTSWLSVFNVLSHLAELPSGRTALLESLNKIALNNPAKPLEEYNHHLGTMIDYAMWEP